MSHTFTGVLEKLIGKTDLNSDEAVWLMNETMSGNLSPAQIAAWLVAMRVKGEIPLEISSFASVMRQKAVSLSGLGESLLEPLLDTCGTGGDKSNLVNISTLGAIVLASRAVRVAKHGNRSVSSNSGSADFLERAGYPLNETPQEIVSRINRKNFGFFFAPAFHPAMKFAGPVRKEIGIRTVFNILGPLSNPAHATIHLMGVFSRDYIKIMAEALQQLGAKTFLVVHSTDGLDEISPLAPTDYCLYHDGIFTNGSFNPGDSKSFPLKIKSLSELTVQNGDEAFDLGVKILSGLNEPGAEMVAMNAAAGEYLWELHQKKTSEDLQTYLISKTREIKEMILLGKCKLDKVLHG
jgi:anthranilate phosphoribosyltransferase